MKGIISTFWGLIAAVISSFFVFALQGLYQYALGAGLLAVLTLFIKSLTVSAATSPNPVWMPSRSQRHKMRRLKLAKG